MLEQYDLGNLMVLDIETVPQYSSFDKVPDVLQELWAHKTQYQRKDETPREFYERAGLRVKSFAGHEEKELLEDFGKMLSAQPSTIILCAHNGKEFDFPYICRRMLINGVPFPPHLQIAGRKPWEIPHLDTMELWKFGDYKNYTSLSLLTAIFNIPTSKDDIDGSEVGNVYWVEDDLQRIRTYCQKDVVTVAQVYLRLNREPLISPENIEIK